MQTNPFATRYIQPGSMSYEFFGRSSVGGLTERFFQLPSRQALIYGPHGSGKSTLVASLILELEHKVPKSSLHSIRFSTDASARANLKGFRRTWKSDSVVVLDGYEQVGVWSRALIGWTMRQRSIRILATAHQSIAGWDILWKTDIDEPSSEWVVEKLVSLCGSREMSQRLLASEEWAISRKKHGQNLRESLFDMYDWWHNNISDIPS